MVETASPCGETEWSEIPELICLDTRGLTMSPCVKIIIESGNVEINKMLQPDWGMARLESRRRS